MIHIIESEQYGKIEINREQGSVFFKVGDHKYIMDRGGEFYDQYGILWAVRFLGDRIVIERSTWEEIGRTKL